LGVDDKKLFGMLMGRDEQELHWMATLLRQALGTGSSQAGEQSPADAPAPAETDALGGRKLPEDFNFDGMTVEERLRVAGLSEEFTGAAKRADREAMLDMLDRVRLPRAGAAAFADEFLAHQRQLEA
jgi:hypothetical protein